jgi:hypothetical protein
VTASYEFNNRIAAQRAILRTVNRFSWSTEPLVGLSNKAIDRWLAANQIEPASSLALLVKGAAAKLFFLANKSQEQISTEYVSVRSEIIATHESIKSEIAALVR